MMTAAQKVETAQRGYAFKLFRLHLPIKTIAQQVGTVTPVVRKWMKQDDWETRRAALVQIEVPPGWADDLFQLVVIQNKRLTKIEVLLAELVALAAPADAAEPALVE